MKTRASSIIFSLLFSLFPSFGFIDPANAASSISIGTTTFGAGVATNVGVSLSGFDVSQNYQVTVKFVNTATNVDVTNGTLTATQGSTSLISGYTSYAAAKLGFKGSYSAVSNALSTLTWAPSAASGDISIRIGIASEPGTNEFYDANSGHYYKYVSTATSWTLARTAAENSTLFGLKGYLAEINTEAENNFIGNETSATNIWIGATEDATTRTSYTGSSYNGSDGQKWIWEGAVVAPLPTGSGALAQSASASFSSWASGEPNNDSKPGQDCAVTNWSGAKGKWNDLTCSSSQGYLIEFGGRPTETSTAVTQTLTTTVIARESVTLGTLNSNINCTFDLDCSFPLSLTDPSAKNASNQDVPGTFAYSSSNINSTSVSTVSGGASVSLIAPGSSTITVTFTPTDTSIYASSSKSFTITVAGAPQTSLTISTTSGSMNGLNLVTTGGSGTIAVTYSVSNGTATGCSISGSTLTSTTPGSCLVTATNPANGNYAAVSSVQTTVALSASNSAAFSAFSFVTPSAVGIVDNTAFTISITVPYGTSLNSLVPSFTLATGASVKVGSTTQVSGTTSNNFSSPITYTVTAQDGVTVQSYIVTVTTGAAPPAFTLSTSSEIATIGSEIRGYTINSTGGTISNFSISPAISNGLIFNSSTGRISGTPAAAASLVIYTITATNETSSASVTFEVLVNPGRSSISSL